MLARGNNLHISFLWKSIVFYTPMNQCILGCFLAVQHIRFKAIETKMHDDYYLRNYTTMEENNINANIVINKCVVSALSFERSIFVNITFSLHFLLSINFTYTENIYTCIYTHARTYIYVYMYSIIRISHSSSQNTARYERNHVTFGKCSAWFPRILDTTFINYTLFVIGTQARIVKISNIRYTYDLKLLYIL